MTKMLWLSILVLTVVTSVDSLQQANFRTVENNYFSRRRETMIIMSTNDEIPVILIDLNGTMSTTVDLEPSYIETKSKSTSIATDSLGELGNNTNIITNTLVNRIQDIELSPRDNNNISDEAIHLYKQPELVVIERQGILSFLFGKLDSTNQTTVNISSTPADSIEVLTTTVETRRKGWFSWFGSTSNTTDQNKDTLPIVVAVANTTVKDTDSITRPGLFTRWFASRQSTTSNQGETDNLTIDKSTIAAITTNDNQSNKRLGLMSFFVKTYDDVPIITTNMLSVINTTTTMEKTGWFWFGGKSTNVSSLISKDSGKIGHSKQITTSNSSNKQSIQRQQDKRGFFAFLIPKDTSAMNKTQNLSLNQTTTNKPATQPIATTVAATAMNLAFRQQVAQLLKGDKQRILSFQRATDRYRVRALSANDYLNALVELFNLPSIADLEEVILPLVSELPEKDLATWLQNIYNSKLRESKDQTDGRGIGFNLGGLFSFFTKNVFQTNETNLVNSKAQSLASISDSKSIVNNNKNNAAIAKAVERVPIAKKTVVEIQIRQLARNEISCADLVRFLVRELGETRVKLIARDIINALPRDKAGEFSRLVENIRK